MPPRATTPVSNGHSDDQVATFDSGAPSKGGAVNGSSPRTAPTNSRRRWNTFHWELNLYTAIALTLIYVYAVPEQHRPVMHWVFALIAVDAARYYYIKGSMAGVPYTLPLVSLFAMIVRPNRFWAEMADIAMSTDGMCSNTLVGKFMCFVTDPAKCRQVMTGEGTYGMYAHPNAVWLFDPKNLIYLPKEQHKRFRAILTPALFSEQALLQYAAVQERVVRKYLAKFADGEPMDARILFRQMAAASSQESFLGPYLEDEHRATMSDDILTFTMGFLCVPFPYLNTGLYKAIAAKHRIEKIIREIVPRARTYVRDGKPPRCMMEHWLAAIDHAAAEDGCASAEEMPLCADDNMARALLDMMFAAQDATNSALTYSLDVLAAHPAVLGKLRQEALEQCGVDKEGNIREVWAKARDGEAMPYTGKVAIELLHHKPPVPMVPHLSKKDSVIGGHRIPKGAVVIPSITYSARVSGASLEFLPERSDPDNLFVKTVTFGAGQHKCPGRRYAESLLKVFLALVSTSYEFERTGPRPTADEFIYFPTIFPVDSEFVIRPRVVTKSS